MTTVRFDVGDPDAWEAAADAVEAELGPVTILCSNAGVNGGSSAEATPWEVWRRVHTWVHTVCVTETCYFETVFVVGPARRQ